MSEGRVCPVTGEVLPPGSSVSASALRRLVVAVSDLPSLMSEVDYALGGLRGAQNSGGGVSRSCEPVNLQLLEEVDEMRDAILVWATALMAYVCPGARIPGGWRGVRQAFTSHASRAAGWGEAAAMVDEVCYAVRRLEALASPKREAKVYVGKCWACGSDVEAPSGMGVVECLECGEEIEVEASRDLMLTRALAIPVFASRARTIVEAIGKVQVKETTFRSYVHRGKLKPVGYEGGRPLYLPRDLLKLVRPIA